MSLDKTPCKYVIGQNSWSTNTNAWWGKVKATFNLINVSTVVFTPPGAEGAPTPAGYVWLCGENVYLVLPFDWCGTCTLAKIKPSSLVISDKEMQDAIQKHGHHNSQKNS